MHWLDCWFLITPIREEVGQEQTRAEFAIIIEAEGLGSFGFYCMSSRVS
jgi:hypothetical protein